MADFTPLQTEGVPETMRSRYRDKDDTTHALVVAASVEAGGVPVDDDNPMPIDDVWSLALQEDLALADSDKLITVPAGVLWQVMWLFLDFTTTAAVGNRQIQVDFRSASAVVAQQRPNTVQAASLQRFYMMAPALANQAAFYDTDHIQTPLPPSIFLPAGYSVRVWDNNAIDPGQDNLLVRMMVASKTV